MLNVKTVHITTMCKQNEFSKRNLIFGMSCCDKGTRINEFNMILMPKEKLHGNVSIPITHTDFYLLMHDPNGKCVNGYKFGTAFQNGKIVKEYSININGLHQHHYIIEYAGKYIDNAKICI